MPKKTVQCSPNPLFSLRTTLGILLLLGFLLLDLQAGECYGERTRKSIESAARSALIRRDFKAAKVHLASLVSAAGTSSYYQGQATRLQKTADILERYWEVFTAKLDGLDRGVRGTMAVAGTEVVIIEATKTQLIIRAEGENISYKSYQIPYNICEVIHKSLPQTIGNDVGFATAALFNEYTPRLSLQKLVSNIKIRDKSGEFATIADEFTASYKNRRPAPPTDDVAITAAEEKVRELFAGSFSRATNAAGNVALATVLCKALEAHPKVAEDQEMLWATLDQAQKAATAGNDIQALVLTLDKTHGYFSISKADLVLQHFPLFIKANRANKLLSDTASFVNMLGRKEYNARRRENAYELSRVARDAAKKAGDAINYREAAALAMRSQPRPATVPKKKKKP